ncbi:MAG: phosphoenolpyruvate carboxykinase domain-containing protein, partial [Acidimicrobiia bacterium]
GGGGGGGEEGGGVEGGCERVDGESSAVKTPVGLVPSASALDTAGLDVPRGDLEEILRFDAEGWASAVPQIKEHYAKFGDHLPSALHESLAALERELVK